MTEKNTKNTKPVAYPIKKRLVIKAIGGAEQILRFIDDIQKVYLGHRMNFSPVIRNKDTPGYHCFINLLMLLPEIKEAEEHDHQI